PGLEVIRTTIRSDSTVVPPVTADRSPPDSLITGADSPVMADSSTAATPSTTSPSPGMTWPASTVLRCPAHHQPGHEHGDDGEDQDAVQARPDAAGHDLAERHVEQRDAAAERGQRVVEAVHRAGGRHRGGRGEQRAARRAEPRLGALGRAVREL